MNPAYLSYLRGMLDGWHADAADPLSLSVGRRHVVHHPLGACR